MEIQLVELRTEGLSPRVRGNHRGDRLSRWCGRSIPACAGEPSPAAVTTADSRVYPRVCGGTIGSADYKGESIGLSPRVRGNLSPPG